MSTEPLLFSALRMDRSVLVYGGQVQLVPLMSAINEWWPQFDLIDLRRRNDNPHEHRRQVAEQISGAQTLVIWLPERPTDQDRQIVSELLNGRLEMADHGRLLSPQARIIGICLEAKPAPTWIDLFPFRLKDAQALGLPRSPDSL